MTVKSHIKPPMGFTKKEVRCIAFRIIQVSSPFISCQYPFYDSLITVRINDLYQVHILIYPRPGIANYPEFNRIK